ncbi:MAG: hypothetical protein AMXMBFR33_54680 [Candidatus Xenobia bacterium]
MPFHIRPRQERRRRGWTQKELALRARVSRAQISHFERNTRPPRDVQVVRLAGALGISPLELRGGSCLQAAEAGWAEWLMTSLWRRFSPRPGRYRLDRERDNWVRLRAARKVYPEHYNRYLTLALERLGRKALTDLLRYACCGSGMEMLSWLRLLELALISYVSLARVGWRSLPVLEDPSGEVVGDRLWPALVLEGPFLVALFPQVRVLTSAGPYRMDFLACVRLSDRLVWLNVEVDGPYHCSKLDDKRQKAIRIPRVKLTEDDLLAPDFLDRFWSKLGRAAGYKAVG